METEQVGIDTLVQHAERQTKALETLRTIAVWLTGMLAAGLFFGLLFFYVSAVS